MVKFVIRSLLYTFILAIFAVACASAQTATMASGLVGEDEVVVQRLIRGSPWKGTWGTTGKVVFGFRTENGHLRGEMLETNYTEARPGPLRWVTVKVGILTFTSETGVHYELRPTPDGRFKGELAYNIFGRRSIYEIELEPTK